MMMSTLAMIAGLFILTVAGWRSYRFHSSATWRQALGNVKKTSSYRDHDYNLWPKVEYQYLIEGKEYFGSTIYVSGMWSNFGHYRWIEELLQKYYAGANVAILYNPNNPKVSALERGSWAAIIPLFPAGFIFLWAGIREVLK